MVLANFDPALAARVLGQPVIPGQGGITFGGGQRQADAQIQSIAIDLIQHQRVRGALPCRAVGGGGIRHGGHGRGLCLRGELVTLQLRFKALLVQKAEHIPHKGQTLGQRGVHAVDTAQHGHTGGRPGQHPAPQGQAERLFGVVHRPFCGGLVVYFFQYGSGQTVGFGGGQWRVVHRQGVQLGPECMQISHVYIPFPVVGGAGVPVRG